MKKLLLSLMLAGLITAGCSVNNGNVIIKVNNEPITQAEFDATFDDWVGNSIFASNKDALKDEKNNILYGIFKDKVVNELIYSTLLKQEIQKRNITVSKEDYDKEIERLISILGSKNELNNILRNKGISPSEFKKLTMNELKIRKLADSISKTTVTAEEVEKYYNTRKANFSFPEKVEASHILILANPKEFTEEIKKNNPNISDEELKQQVQAKMDERKAKAEKILKEVQANPRNFAQIAKTKSDDRTSAKNGGALGFFSKKEMVKPFSDAAFSLPINQISNLVQSQFGYHIILVTDRMEAGAYPFEKVKNEIEQTIRTTKQMGVINNLLSSLKNDAVIEFVDKEYEPSALQKMIDNKEINEEE